MSASTARKIRPVEKATGIGGVFFRARDPEALAAWYHDHLGIDTEEGKPWEQQGGLTVFAPFDEATDYFGRREQQWMLKSCEPRSTTSTPRWRRWRWTGERRGRRSARFPPALSALVPGYAGSSTVASRYSRMIPSKDGRSAITLTQQNGCIQ